jgi:hypothetical protein
LPNAPVVETLTSGMLCPAAALAGAPGWRPLLTLLPWFHIQAAPAKSSRLTKNQVRGLKRITTS